MGQEKKAQSPVSTENPVSTDHPLSTEIPLSPDSPVSIETAVPTDDNSIPATDETPLPPTDDSFIPTDENPVTPDEDSVTPDESVFNRPPFPDSLTRLARKLPRWILPFALLVLLLAYGWSSPTFAEETVQTEVTRTQDDSSDSGKTSGDSGEKSGDAGEKSNDSGEKSDGSVPDGMDRDIIESEGLSPDNPDANPSDSSGDSDGKTEDSGKASDPSSGTAEEPKPASELSWRLRDGRVIYTWAGDDETWYVFLPAYAHMVSITAQVREPFRMTLDGVSLNADTDLSRFSIGETYPLRIRSGNRTQNLSLRFLRSANIPAMYIDTSSGSMDQVHADRDYKESVRVALVSGDGTRLYSGVNDTLKGRGQSSWTSPKKSYSLRLQKPKGLLDMKPAVKWALISNTYDHTCLRNKIVSDMAARSGLEWSPECEYVDLYLNGEYAGLYLLSERVEAAVNRLTLPDDRRHTNFLCKVEIYNRWKTLDQPFLTNRNRTIEIVSPEPALPQQLARIQRDTQLLENTILSGNERSLLRYLDLDSWVRRYLIDEISENLEADLASSYFYCVYKGNRPIFYGGPVWDYDATFNNASPFRNINPRAFVANSAWESEGVPTPWFYALYHYDVFYQRVCELFAEEFLPIMQYLEQEGIDKIYGRIEKASNMNRIRWYSETEDVSGNKIKEFISRRAVFLSEAWIDGVEFHTVQVEPYRGQYYFSYSVKDGEGFRDFPDTSLLHLEKDEVLTWYDLETGVIYEPGRPVFKDTILVHWNPNPEEVFVGPEPEGTAPVPVSRGASRTAGTDGTSDTSGAVSGVSDASSTSNTANTSGAANTSNASGVPESGTVRINDPASDPAQREAMEQEKILVPWRDADMLMALLRFEGLTGILLVLIIVDIKRRGMGERI